MDMSSTLQINIATWQAATGLAAFVFAAGVAWGSFRTSIGTLTTSVKTLEQGLNKLSDSSVGSSVRALEQGLEKLSDRFDAFLSAMALRLPNVSGQSNSPMVPTPQGAALLRESGVSAVLDDAVFRADIFAAIDRHKPANGYEVEQRAFSALLDDQPNARWGAVKQFLYNHPVVDGEPVNMLRLFAIAAWVVRDEYMRERRIA